MASPAVPKLIQSCDAHKFETIVHAVVDGQPHDSRVKLCGVEGQSDADWIKTLQDALHKLDDSKDMATAVRDQIVAAIKAEITRLSILGMGPKLTNRVPPAVIPLSRDYSTLPPLPAAPDSTPPQKSAGALPPPRVTQPEPIQKDFAELPLLPPPSAAPVVSLLPAAPAVPLRLTFACDTPGDLATDAPCAAFERETTVTVHAAEDIPAGTLLQFVRNDDPKAEIPISGLRKGAALRTELPADICRGFTSGKLELRVVRSGAATGEQMLNSEGPFSLSC